jgi:ribosomal protein S18 acetylase RimI-like enzyme
MDLEIKFEKNVEVLARLNKFVHDLQRTWHPTIFREYNYETMYKMFDEMLQKDSIYSLIAYSSNQPVGYVILVVRNYDNPLFCEGHKSIYIDQMCVIEEHRNEGVGKIMMEKVKEFSQVKGIKRIELSVWADNVNAIKFYEKMGFDKYLHNMCCNSNLVFNPFISVGK